MTGAEGETAKDVKTAKMSVIPTEVEESLRNPQITQMTQMVRKTSRESILRAAVSREPNVGETPPARQEWLLMSAGLPRAVAMDTAGSGCMMICRRDVMKNCVLLVCLSAAVATASGLDSLVQRLVGQVSEDSVAVTIQRLQGFHTRVSQSESCVAAVEYAMARLRQYDCDTVYPHYFDTLYGPSAIGVKLGRLKPTQEYILCAHIDDWSYPPDWAPGADDDASGCAAVLEACRVFAASWFGYTVRFVCFNAEENGALGSAWYAYQAMQRGDSILGVLNLDMIGYATEGRDTVYVNGRRTNPDCMPLANAFCATADEYTQLKYRTVVDSVVMSGDHESFWNAGYPAVLVCETERTPEYHRVGDTLGPYLFQQCGVNNLPMAAEVTRATVAAIATLGEVEGHPAVTEGPRAREFTGSASTIALGVLTLPAGDEERGSRLLFDISGRTIMDLHPGPNDVRRLAPGVYFYALDNGERTISKKVVLTE